MSVETESRFWRPIRPMKALFPKIKSKEVSEKKLHNLYYAIKSTSKIYQAHANCV